MANKTYGLSFPTRKSTDSEKKRIESIFAAEESDEEEDQLKLKPLPTVQSSHVYQAKIHRKTKTDYEKAMEQDPSVFQYDEIYDDIKNEKEREVESLFGKQEKQSKYVDRLMKTAKERKLERELCSERKAQKELEADAHLYGQKESFMTSAYKSKLIELNELIAKREAEQQVEKRMDITTQDGLGGFYRYMYQHGTGGPQERSLDQPLSKQENEEKETPVDFMISHHTKPEHSKSSKSEAPNRTDSNESPDIRASHRDQRPHCDSQHSHRHRDNSHPNSIIPSDSPRLRRKPSPESLHDSQQSGSDNPIIQKPSVRSDPNFLYAKPRVTTDAQIAEARDRFLQRKSEGIHAVIAESDSEDE